MAGPGRLTTYPQNQLLGGRGHEDAVTPRRTPRVHVPLALAGIFAVRVAEGTGHRGSALPTPAPPLPPAGRVVPPKERLRVRNFPQRKVKLTIPLKRQNHPANSGFSFGRDLKYSEDHPRHPAAGPSRLPLPTAPAWLQALHGPAGSACPQHHEPHSRGTCRWGLHGGPGKRATWGRRALGRA